MPAKSSENAPPKDGSPICQCGRGMSDCLIHPSTPVEWIASMRDSLVRTLALPGIKRALDMRHDPAYIEKSSVLLASFDPVTCSLKTSQQSLVTDSEPYSQTLPRWGSLRNGAVSEHPIAAHRIEETDGSLLPTPTVSSGAQVAWKPTKGQTGGTTLEGWARWFPTPTARMHKGGGKAMTRKDGKERSDMLDWLVEAQEPNGRLNPDWVEWLMGFPIGFTASKGWGTPKSRCKPPLPGNYLEANK